MTPNFHSLMERFFFKKKLGKPVIVFVLTPGGATDSFYLLGSHKGLVQVGKHTGVPGQKGRWLQLSVWCLSP